MLSRQLPQQRQQKQWQHIVRHVTPLMGSSPPTGMLRLLQHLRSRCICKQISQTPVSCLDDSSVSQIVPVNGRRAYSLPCIGKSTPEMLLYMQTSDGVHANRRSADEAPD